MTKLFIIFVVLLLTNFYHAVYSQQATLSELKENFDWITYLDIHPDLQAALSDGPGAWTHYEVFGMKEERFYPKKNPLPSSVASTREKLNSFVNTMDQRKIQLDRRSIVLYLVSPQQGWSSREVMINNIQIFQDAVVSDNYNTSTNFYLFYAVGNHDSNPYLQYLVKALDAPNVGFISFENSANELLLQSRVFEQFHEMISGSFGSVLFTNNEVRGPLAKAEDGNWLKFFRFFLFGDKVGIVGPSILCDAVPHVQPYTYAIRAEVVPLIMKAYNGVVDYNKWKKFQKYYIKFLVMMVKRLKHEISSLLHYSLLHKTVFDGSCLVPTDSAGRLLAKRQQSSGGAMVIKAGGEQSDPLRQCNYDLADVLFLPWGDRQSQLDNYYCPATKLKMKHWAVERGKTLPLLLPETTRGGLYHEVQLQYEQELWPQLVRDYEQQRQPQQPQQLYNADENVCFLVRSSYMHSQDRNISLLDRDYFSGFDNIIQSLRRQSDPRWKAFFFITDSQPFSTKLKKILSFYNESRVSFLHINRKYRIPFTTMDAGYTATDQATTKVLRMRECTYLSYSNADNIYGSDVVKKVLEKSAKGTEMVLAPLDSRNFLYQDLMGRGLHTNIQAACTALVLSFQINILGMTVQPRPIVGKVDLASVFFSRAKLAQENLFFNNFSFSMQRNCAGCQDGYFTEYLVQHRRWNYEHIAVDGLKSIVFHGPSPLWCFAAGLVWFGHPHVNKARCFSHDIVQTLRAGDEKVQQYDWADFDAQEGKCLRFLRY